MNAAQLRPRSIFVILCLVLLAACQPASPTPIAQDQVHITRITLNETLTGQIIQTKMFDRCNAAGAFAAEVKFSESTSEATQKELTFSVNAGAEGGIPGIAQATLAAAVEERFQVAKQTFAGKEESVKIEVPAHTRQEYTIVWKETREEGTIEYTVNGQPKFVNFSYRVGLEFDSATGNDIECSSATQTSAPTQTPREVTATAAVTPTLEPKTLADNCIFSTTWKPDAAVQSSSISTGADGCRELDSLGIFANRGKLQIFNSTGNNAAGGGIYTPIDANSVIEFNIYVSSMSMRFKNTTEVTFAVAPTSDRFDPKSAARFKLHLEDEGSGKVIHFMMADVGENNGVRLGNQHYEYGNVYNVRLALSRNQMDVYINGYRLDESLEIPLGSKMFYIGYTLPIYSEINVEIGDIRVNNIAK